MRLDKSLYGKLTKLETGGWKPPFSLNPVKNTVFTKYTLPHPLIKTGVVTPIVPKVLDESNKTNGTSPIAKTEAVKTAIKVEQSKSAVKDSLMPTKTNLIKWMYYLILILGISAIIRVFTSKGKRSKKLK